MTGQLVHAPVRVLYIGREDPTYERVWADLEREGLSVSAARTQAAGMRSALDMQPQVVIINTADGSFSGDRLCRSLGRRLPGVQRLLIVEHRGRAHPPCEQVLARPFTARKLTVTLQKLAEAAMPQVILAGPVKLDLASRVVTVEDVRHHLTPKQCELLAVLIRHPNQVVSRRDLMERIWNTGYMGDTRTLDVHIRWLREVIEPDAERPTMLVTRRGVGYVLIVPGVDPA